MNGPFQRQRTANECRLAPQGATVMLASCSRLAFPHNRERLAKAQVEHCGVRQQVRCLVGHKPLHRLHSMLIVADAQSREPVPMRLFPSAKLHQRMANVEVRTGLGVETFDRNERFTLVVQLEDAVVLSEQMTSVSRRSELAESLQGDSLLPAARAIMTTDRYPKLRAQPAAGGRVCGIAKGAGMIEPNMATMLAFVLTDVAIPRGEMQRMLRAAADASFNCMSVDADQSTSDTLVCVLCRKPSDQLTCCTAVNTGAAPRVSLTSASEAPRVPVLASGARPGCSRDAPHPISFRATVAASTARCGE